MYTIKTNSRYEIRVIGQGENGLCLVTLQGENVTRCLGTYSDCLEWLARRGIKTIS